MALLNFKAESEDKLRGILGSYVTEEDRPRLRLTDSYVEKFYYKVTQIIQGTVVGSEETYTEYKAIQVNPDGTEVENGIVFDSDQQYKDDADSPLYLPNLQINKELFSGSVELGKAYQVEEIDPEDISTGLEPVYYIIPKGGGGASIFRLKCLSDTAIAYGATSTNFSLIDNDDNITELNVTVTQRKFTTANFYENEILYAQSDSVGYDLSPFLAGIGGTSA